MEIDVRQTSEHNLDTIRVASTEEAACIAEVIFKDDDGGVYFRDTEGGDDLMILNKKHAEYLRIGLLKAIELGWLK